MRVETFPRAMFRIPKIGALLIGAAACPDFLGGDRHDRFGRFAMRGGKAIRYFREGISLHLGEPHEIVDRVVGDGRAVPSLSKIAAVVLLCHLI